MRWLLFGLGASAILLAGCGGGGHLSHREFGERANAICSAYQSRIRSVGILTSLSNLRIQTAAAESITNEHVARFAALEPPEEDEAGARAYVEHAERLATALERLRQAYGRGPATVRRLFRAALREAAALRRVARALGLAECAAR